MRTIIRLITVVALLLAGTVAHAELPIPIGPGTTLQEVLQAYHRLADGTPRGRRLTRELDQRVKKMHTPLRSYLMAHIARDQGNATPAYRAKLDRKMAGYSRQLDRRGAVVRSIMHKLNVIIARSK